MATPCQISLRVLAPEDAGRLTALLKDETIKKTYMIPDFSSDEEAAALAERLRLRSLDASRYVRGVYLGARLVGFVNDVAIAGGEIELGYVVDPAFHNRGFATQALALAMGELFARGFDAVVCGAFEHNAASRRVMEKNGMTRTGKTEVIAYRGREHVCVYYCRRAAQVKCFDH